MADEKPVPTLCRYLLKPGKEGEFQAVLARHWHTLHEAGLATHEPARIYRAQDKAGNVAFVEMFSWKTAGSAQAAHESPDVMRVWEPMGALAKDMEFWHIEPWNG